MPPPFYVAMWQQFLQSYRRMLVIADYATQANAPLTLY
jgi:hypothetical protein